MLDIIYPVEYRYGIIGGLAPTADSDTASDQQWAFFNEPVASPGVGVRGARHGHMDSW